MVPQDTTLSRTHEDETVTSPEERRETFGLSDRVRMYGSDFADRLSDAGFSVSVRPYADELDASTVRRHGLRVNDYFDREWVNEYRRGRAGKAERIYHCTK
jgi:hypothetical protein